MSAKHVTLKLTPAQFVIIYEFLYNTQLGDRNHFESEISDLMIEMDTEVTRMAINDYIKHEGQPKIKAHIDKQSTTFSVHPRFLIQIVK